jgi:hypothetical protein
VRVYIAGPFTDPRPEVVAWHVARACLLGRLATECGHAPVVVHPSIAAGVYGDDAVAWQRERGLRAALEVMHGCDALWALLRDDGTMSSGTAGEWRDFDGKAEALTWAGWRGRIPDFDAERLAAWDALAVKP